MRNLIIYKVEYRLNSDPWDRDKFIKTKRIVMPLSEYDNSGGRYHNHSWIKKNFVNKWKIIILTVIADIQYGG